LEDVPLRALTAAVVREWYATALRGAVAGLPSRSPIAFFAVMNTAVHEAQQIHACAGRYPDMFERYGLFIRLREAWRTGD